MANFPLPLQKKNSFVSLKAIINKSEHFRTNESAAIIAALYIAARQHQELRGEVKMCFYRFYFFSISRQFSEI